MKYKLEDTRITSAGVFRCCLASVAEEYIGEEVEIGMKSECKHCKEKFTLTDDDPPLWKPDWQIS